MQVTLERKKKRKKKKTNTLFCVACRAHLKEKKRAGLIPDSCCLKSSHSQKKKKALVRDVTQKIPDGEASGTFSLITRSMGN